jgi:hypothetical protein
MSDRVWLTTAEAARICGVSVRAIRKRIAKGQLTVRIERGKRARGGKQYFIALDSLDAAASIGKSVLTDVRTVTALVLQELARARSLHGPIAGRHEGYAVTLGELDELWEECKKRNPDLMRLRKEAIQVAAMAMRFVLDVCPIEERASR